MNRLTKVALILGVILTLYGYICRLGIYFFWESKYIGWALIMIGAIGFLAHRIKLKKEKRKRTLFEKIGIGILVFVLLIQILLMIAISSMDALKVSKEYLRNDVQLKNDIGNITGFSLIPQGASQTSSTGDTLSGSAIILLIVKGEKKFKEVTVHVEKKPDTQWKVIGTE